MFVMKKITKVKARTILTFCWVSNGRCAHAAVDVVSASSKKGLRLVCCSFNDWSSSTSITTENHYKSTYVTVANGFWCVCTRKAPVQCQNPRGIGAERRLVFLLSRFPTTFVDSVCTSFSHLLAHAHIAVTDTGVCGGVFQCVPAASLSLVQSFFAIAACLPDVAPNSVLQV